MSESREFFTTKTVAQALAGFRPARRTPAETVPLARALRRVPAVPVTAPRPLPGFARSTVDGYAVRAADTYGVSEGLPGYLTVTGAVAMGAAPTATVGPGTAVAMPTGGALPPGADAVVMIEYTAKAHVLLGDLLARGGGPADVDGTVRELATVMRRTSICGLGQVALGPVSSVLRLTGVSDGG